MAVEIVPKICFGLELADKTIVIWMLAVADCRRLLDLLTGLFLLACQQKKVFNPTDFVPCSRF